MKSKMEKLPHLVGVGTEEQFLFHGTPDEATVRCICYQNFDPRMHGRHGTVYGKGVYFSSTAKYSHQYTRHCVEKNGRRFMFLARVLVGKSVVGNPELQRPPPVNPSRPHGSLYDSCVDSTSTPTIFVIFDNDQCYPEFLIEYELCEKEAQRHLPPAATPPVSARLPTKTVHPRALGLYPSTTTRPSTAPVPAAASQIPPSKSILINQFPTSPAAAQTGTVTTGIPRSSVSSETASARESKMGCVVM